ncbi:hypothetical protein AQ490_16675 [Wenjunlia vitaminophila]|uniref:Uncharacterized protein n=1 Tax=Wenjunlia vitaminophila TaxID=76728 RepID=A0A0T6LXH2_WENVI|nr:hypothetical protein [Wenjunlia vitaminophila]KRV50672.1 hypothetical protein AQ490_16640 [Wenjunlia vitaminophila]KRV50678.1 hypothetical protein AQ490_16675 [Wenjunlia vitaminophila]
MGKSDRLPPSIGAVALDIGTNRVGVIMDHMGGRVQLRPVHGGREWDARKEEIRPADEGDPQ